MNAIETTYRGYKFRSRLEAKWACVFDQIKWKWEYEPVDLDGYIPDFYVDFGRDQFFIEIKPSMKAEDLDSAYEKAERAIQHQARILVLGGSIGSPSSDQQRWELVALMEAGFECGGTDDVYLAGCPTCRRHVPLTMYGQWGFPCCSSDTHADHKHYNYELPADVVGIERAWAFAHNETKWARRS